MKNLILRYLISYIVTAIVYYFYLLLDKNVTAYFKYALFFFLIPINFISTLTFYFIIGYISKKKRIILTIFFILLILILPLVFDLDNPLIKNDYYTPIFYISIISLPQLLIPNFNSKNHPWDNILNVKQSIFLIVGLLGIIICYLFFL